MFYTDTDALKSFLNITDMSQDDYLETLIEQATALVDIELGDNLGKKTFTRRVDGNGTDRIIMENSINSVTSVKIAREDYPIEVEFIEGSTIHLMDAAPRGTKNIEVVYEKGYDTVPPDFSRFFLEYCRELYNMQKEASTQVVKSKKLGDLSLTFFAPSELTDEKFLADLSIVIRKYKNFNLY